MDINCYAMEQLVEARLAERRADAARYALLASLKGGRRGLRAILGFALIRAGRWMTRRAISSPRPA